jgi:hypothetical protein
MWPTKTLQKELDSIIPRTYVAQLSVDSSVTIVYYYMAVQQLHSWKQCFSVSLFVEGDDPPHTQNDTSRQCFI